MHIIIRVEMERVIKNVRPHLLCLLYRLRFILRSYSASFTNFCVGDWRERGGGGHEKMIKNNSPVCSIVIRLRYSALTLYSATYHTRKYQKHEQF